MRLLFALFLAATLSGCAMLGFDSTEKNRGLSLWPFGESRGEDATAYLEYQRTRGKGEKARYTVMAHNTHATRTITGQIRTTTEVMVGGTRVDSQVFTLRPNEQKQVLTYPVNARVTYEVTATFQ